MKNIQEMIDAWRYQTYGDSNAAIEALWKKLEEEVEELMTCSTPKRGEELADVTIVLFGLASTYGYDLEEEVRKKFQIVSNRDQLLRDTQRGLL